MDCREMILSNNVYDYITDFQIGEVEGFETNFCYEDIEGLYNIVYLSKNVIANQEVSFFQYQSIPKVYGLMQTGNFNPTSLIASGITQIQRPPLSLSGEGVIICIIDTGVRYQEPVFRDENGNSRILAIWDQTIQTGEPPQGFSYGTEYTGEQINEALRSDTPLQIVPSRDENGHGTTLAAVAAGSVVGGSNPFQGAAPGADIVVVKLKPCKQYLREFYLLPEEVPAYQENDIMLAVKYADSFAELFRRPVVICLGLGTNMGDHTGSSALSRYLNIVAVRRSRAVVVCGGNEGNASHHFRGVLEQKRDALQRSTDVEIRVSGGVRGFFAELWGGLPDILNVEIRSPGGENIPIGRLLAGQTVTYGFVYDRSRVTVRSVLVEPASGAQLTVFRLENPSAGIWTITVSAEGDVYNGEFHMWLPITQFLASETYFLQPNPYTTLTEPAMAENVIAVSAYDADNNSFYFESGRGFSRNGRVRPDFAAPGVDVSTLSGEQTGSSLAAAITAGAVAQLLEWTVVEQNNQFAESREIKNYLIRGAARNADTRYPNREWGYGRLDMEGVFKTISGI